MELGSWLVAVVTLAGSAFLTTVIGILLKRSFDKFFEKRDKELQEFEEYKSRRIEEERVQLKEDIVDAVEEAVAPIKRDLYILKKGTQAGLRHDLSQMADEWLVKGYCPRNVKDDFENIYKQYHKLGKNGVMNNLYQSILALPEVKPKPRSSTTKKSTNKSVLNG